MTDFISCRLHGKDETNLKIGKLSSELTKYKFFQKRKSLICVANEKLTDVQCLTGNEIAVSEELLMRVFCRFYFACLLIGLLLIQKITCQPEEQQQSLLLLFIQYIELDL